MIYPIIIIILIFIILIFAPLYFDNYFLNPQPGKDYPIRLCDTIRSFYFKYKYKLLGKTLNKKVCLENLRILKTVFDKYNIVFLLSEGTALGAIRERDFIHYDDDVDICTLEPSHKIERVIPKLINYGFEVTEIKNRGSKFIGLIRKGEKLDIDIIKKNKICNTLVKDPNCNKILPYLINYSYINFLGLRVRVPDTRYLEYVYGKDWMIPQQGKKPIN